MVVVLYSNGVELDHFKSYKLMSYGIDEIRISLDDISTDINYASSHGIDENKAYYSNLKDNLVKLVDLRSNNGFSTILGASFVLSNKNYENFDDSIKTLSEWLNLSGQLDYLIVRPAIDYWPSGENYSNYTLGIPEDYHTNINIKNIKEKQVARHVFISKERFEVVTNSSSDEGLYSKCLAANLWLNIGPTGDAYVCCETKHMHDNYKIGNILVDDITKILKASWDKRTDPSYAKAHPVSLCKPSQQNIIFDKLNNLLNSEDPGENRCAKEWLDDMEERSKESILEMSIPSVSGIYEEKQ